VAQVPTGAEADQPVAAGTQVSEWPEPSPRIKNPAYEGDRDVTRKDTTSAACVFGDPDARSKRV